MHGFPSRKLQFLFLPLTCALMTGQAFAETAPGVQWETTSQMSMEGMSFGGPQKFKVCAKADATEPPGSTNEERGCTNADFIRTDEPTGRTVTWTSNCSGPPAMTGQGRITYNEAGDAYEGEITYATADGTVVIELTGTRIGECANPR